ncbi:MAG: hypothetical protein OEU36_01485 [Gammaproteobacteria bacterium]|nr:hypothetical protein [Gammaproteobacteria bacterium]
MTWLLILVIVLILAGVVWGLASRVGRGFDVKQKKLTKSEAEKSNDEE